MMLCEPCDGAVALAVSDWERRKTDEATESRLRRSGLPADYRSGSRMLGDLPLSALSEALTACQMLGSGIRGLYLSGPARSFKTSVAASWLASQIRGGASGLYVSAIGLTTDIMASYRRDDGESRADIIEQVVNAPCLVIDDLGKEKASDHAAGVLFEILDGRFNNGSKGHWMIVTSNYGIDQICDRFEAGEEITGPIRHRLSVLCVSVPMGKGKKGGVQSL